MGQVSSVAFKLEIFPLVIHNVFHMSLLKLYFGNDEDKFPGRRKQPPPPVIIDGHEEFEVERILDHKWTRGKGSQYQVVWKGWPLYDSTWEYADNLRHAQEAIDAFWRDAGHIPHSPRRNIRRSRSPY
jgi:hypothetical protein